jgi:hypothetical protein
MATSPNQCYQVTFLMAAEFPTVVPQVRSLDVKWNGTTVASVQFNPAGYTDTNMGWATHTVNVIGTGADRLSFVSTTTNPPGFGPALDGISVLPNPSIAASPTSQATCSFGTATFSTTASGTGPFTYQWRKDTIAIDTIANPSAATATLTLTSVGPADVASYDCIVTNACGSVTSNAATLAICAANINCDTTVDFGDFLAFFNCYDAEQSCADIDGNPGTDFGDFLAFFNAYDVGC